MPPYLTDQGNEEKQNTQGLPELRKVGFPVQYFIA